MYFNVLGSLALINHLNAFAGVSPDIDFAPLASNGSVFAEIYLLANSLFLRM